MVILSREMEYHIWKKYIVDETLKEKKISENFVISRTIISNLIYVKLESHK